MLLNSGGDHTDRIDLLEPVITGNELYVRRLAPGSVVRMRSGTVAQEVTPTSEPGAVWVPGWRAYSKPIDVFP